MEVLLFALIVAIVLIVPVGLADQRDPVPA